MSWPALTFDGTVVDEFDKDFSLWPVATHSPLSFAANPASPPSGLDPALGRHAAATVGAASSTWDTSEDCGLQRPRSVRGQRGKRRTAAQQRQNQLAQQRYRERRKQKTLELERRVEELVAQLDASAGQECALPHDEEISTLRRQIAEQQQLIEELQQGVQSMSAAVEGEATPCEQASAGGLPALSADQQPPEQVKLEGWFKSLTPEEALAHIIELAGCVRNLLTSTSRQDLPMSSGGWLGDRAGAWRAPCDEVGAIVHASSMPSRQAVSTKTSERPGRRGNGHNLSLAR